MIERERAKAVEWFKARAAAEYATEAWCIGNGCAPEVSEYHRNRGSAFVDAAVAIETQTYLKKFERDCDGDMLIDLGTGKRVEMPPPRSEYPPDEDMAGEKDAQRVYLEYRGERLLMSQWARRLGLSTQVLSSRRRQGWTVEEIIETPLCTGRGIVRKVAAE